MTEHACYEPGPNYKLNLNGHVVYFYYEVMINTLVVLTPSDVAGGRFLLAGLSLRVKGQSDLVAVFIL